jgi:ubiquinone/menaquinone biosynthesis C-methylase UbiE
MGTQATRPVYEKDLPGEVTSLGELRTALSRLRGHNSSEFASCLEERKRQERQWANFSRDRRCAANSGETEEQRRGNAKWYSTTQLSLEYRNAWLAERVPGKVFLDYACGDGLEAIKVARLGAALSMGIDISNVSVANAAETAAREGLSDKCVFLEGDCEATGLPDASVDVVLCSYMLHHLDLDHAYPELHRILKPGGSILACEALNYNPLIKLYRNLTPAMRTEWEKRHILSLKDVRKAKKHFNVGAIRYWHLSSVLGVFVRKAPPVFGMVMPILNATDSILLEIPGVQLLAWQFSFELFKPLEKASVERPDEAVF